MSQQNDWNPQDYLRFARERNRPAMDLLSQIQHHSAEKITDLGCGAGNSTALLRANWQNATIIGVDSSPNMLLKAKENLPDCEFVLQDFHAWQPETPQDVIFANASLQWSDTPEILFAHLIENLAENGILAAQMPDNLQEPSHTMMNETAHLPKWRDLLANVPSRPNMLNVSQYDDLLTENGCQADIWRTVYYHVLDSVADIAEMFGSTALRPYLGCLNANQQIEFKQDYIQNLQKHYPTQKSGKVLLALPRLFIVARKKSSKS